MPWVRKGSGYADALSFICLSLVILFAQCKSRDLTPNDAKQIAIPDAQTKVTGILPDSSIVEIRFSKPMRIICDENDNAIRLIPTAVSTFCEVRIVYHQTVQRARLEADAEER